MVRSTRVLQDMKLQRAIRWISATLMDTPHVDHAAVIDRASQSFGLSPRQEEFLYHMYLPQPDAGTVGEQASVGAGRGGEETWTSSESASWW
jgi:hypothetical protein